MKKNLFLNLCFRKFGYVDFATEEELQKALELNGKKMLGQEIKLDRARNKEDSGDVKKGRLVFLLFVFLEFNAFL